MKKTVCTVLTLSSLLAPMVSMAGTVIEISNRNDKTTVLTDGKQARMNTGGGDYILVNYATQSVKMVQPSERKVMSLNAEDMPRTGNAPTLQTSIRRLGEGPVIAGYDTVKFSYSVNGRDCGVIYGSQDAYGVSGIKDMFKAMRTMMERQRSMMGGFAGMVDQCTLGDIEMSKNVSKVGVPMRIQKNGATEMEVKSIKLGVALPADTFTVPANYKTVTVKEEMQKAGQDMARIQQQMQQHQPEIQQMIQQMQQSGQMPPEALEQMRRAQEMMQRYQQPR